MSVQNEAKTKFAVMCSQMLPYFSLPEFNRETAGNELRKYLEDLNLLSNRS